MGTLQPAKYGKVVGRLMAIVGDGPDEDEYPVAGGFPDARPLAGTVTFTPRVGTILVAGAQPDPVTAFAHPVTAQLDENGYLTLNGKKGVFLICPSAETNPSFFTYSVRYSVTLDQRPVSTPAFDIELVEYVPGPDPDDPDEGSTAVNLTLMTPAQPSAGTPVVRGPKGDSVTDIALSADGTALVFTISRATGDEERTVPVPALPLLSDAETFAAIAGAGATTATEKAEDAADFAAAAAASAAEAAGYVGGVADNTITSAKIVDGSIMDVDINASAGISQSKIAGLVDDLAGKAPTSHTHTAAQISDSGTAGRAVLTAETPSAARSAIGAGTSSLTLGTTGTTACAGNDPRLADQRVPTDSSVTSAKIADGTIVDGDISPSAAIALSKLAAGRVAGSDNAGARTLTIWVGTEAQYTAIGTKDANTLYFRTA
ncbi:phage upper tail fiber protein [Rhodococcus ruber]|uniref:phage upper tail fiber protein n=2 Tax=Rhodococcus ruber TaxID=1830 RepID=UPI003D817188